MSFVIICLCSLLLLLCERKITTFYKENIWDEYDVFSESRQVLILSFRPTITAATYILYMRYLLLLSVLSHKSYK